MVDAPGNNAADPPDPAPSAGERYRDREIERLRHRVAELEAGQHVLEQLLAEAQQARVAAEATSAARMLYLANLSHELRTPLNAVTGFAQLLNRDQSLGERQRDLARMIDRSGGHLLTLLNDMIELGQLEAGRLTLSPAPFALQSLLDDVVGLFQLRAEAKGLQLRAAITPDSAPYLLGDEGRLRQVLINLLGNALKFTHRGEVALWAAARPQGQQLRLTVLVSDTGEGIAPDEQATIFLPFAQSRAGRQAREGSGLGLAISRQLARLMGGDIHVVSAPGQGSTFRCELLVEAADPPPERPVECSLVGLVTSGRRYRVLVAGPNWQERQLLAAWLAEAGLEVNEAAESHEALARWARWRPHVVLLADPLPQVDGEELAQRIKHSPAGRATVLICLVPPGLPSHGYPCDGRLERPITREQLLEQLAQQLGLELRYSPAGSSEPCPLPRSPAALAMLPGPSRELIARAAAANDPAALTAAIATLAGPFPQQAAALAALAADMRFSAISALLARTDEQP